MGTAEEVAAIVALLLSAGDGLRDRCHMARRRRSDGALPDQRGDRERAGDRPDGTPVGPWRRRSRAVGYENPWITVFHDEVVRPDGSPGIYGVVHFENTAVGVVAIDDQDRVALVAQHRYTLDHRSWEIPEGGAPAGESPLAGAQRELREEAGVEARRVARDRPGAHLQLGDR